MSNFNKALVFALNKHDGQKRKNGSLYIFHPLEVSIIASTIKNDEDLLCASLLHDTIEDTNTTKEEIESNFGTRVLELVLSETEDKMEGVSKDKTWLIRKEKSLEVLKNTSDIDIKILWLADKLSNLRSFYRDFLNVGLDVFNVCNQKDPMMHKWYYETILDNVFELKDTIAYKEFSDLITKIFG